MRGPPPGDCRALGDLGGVPQPLRLPTSFPACLSAFAAFLSALSAALRAFLTHCGVPALLPGLPFATDLPAGDFHGETHGALLGEKSPLRGEPFSIVFWTLPLSFCAPVRRMAARSAAKRSLRSCSSAALSAFWCSASAAFRCFSFSASSSLR